MVAITATRTYTVTPEECAVTETLQVMQIAQGQLAGLNGALQSIGDQLSEDGRVNALSVLAELEDKVRAATADHADALLIWMDAGCPTYRGRGTPMRWNRA